MMNRRTALPLIGASVAMPLRAARAQKSRTIPVIGVLTTGGKLEVMRRRPTPNFSLDALLKGLAELDYVEGRDFLIEPRGGENTPALFPGMIAELIEARPAVIVAPGAVRSLIKAATRTIPVVMAGVDAPEADGLIDSLARPGGNFTGLSSQSLEVTGKRMELLKELAPSVKPIGVLWNQQSALIWREAEKVALARGWPVVSIEIREASEIENAFAAAVQAQAGGLLVDAGSLLFGRAGRVARLAAQHRLPAIYPARSYVENGGLISYAPNLNDIWRRAAGFVDKILKGVKPGDIPVQQPTKFELVINGTTAKSLGLTIPPTLLAFATEVIE